MAETIGLVDMGNEAAVCADLPLKEGYYSVTSGEDVSSLTKFLERPVVVTGGDVGSAPGTLWSYAFPDTNAYRVLFGVNNWDRLKGITGIRATLVFTVSVTSSAFNQGILALAYQHGVSDLTNNRARHRYFPYVTNLPHVKLNLASNTMMQLEVPFVSNYEYIPIDNVNNTTVNGGIVSLTSLAASYIVLGQDPPRYTVYVSMKDVECIGAVPYDVSTVVLQGGIDQKRSTVSKAVKTVGMVTKGISEITKEAKDTKIVSNTLSGLSKVARVASYVPGLGAIGGTVDWFASYAARTAKSMGYSKPLDETHITRMTRQAYGLDGQVDVPSNGFALAGFQGNKVSVGPDLGMMDEDEMQLDYILSKYQYIYRGSYATTNAVGDVLYAAPICPTAFWYRDFGLGASTPRTNKPLKTSNTATENAFLPSTLCYVADSFRYWRGAYKFRFSFAKTKMHGGRVQVTFVPYTTSPANNSPFSGSTIIPTIAGGLSGPVATGYSYIFDLRDADEFEFEVPYICNQPYMSTYRSIGDISMVTLSDLKSSPAVSEIVEFMVEVCAMEGYELAVPAPSIMAGVPDSGTVSITFQSGLSLAPAVDDISQQIVGERFTSVKQLIMMPDYFPADAINNAFFEMNFDPWFKTNSPPLTTPMSPTAVALWFASRSSRFAGLYAFARGATMAIVQKDIGSTRNTVLFKYKGQMGGNAPTTFSSFYDKSLNFYSSVAVADTLESVRAKIPIYGPFARYVVDRAALDFGGSSLAPSTTNWSNTTANVVPVLTARNNTGANSRLFIGRAAADDATLSRFIGPPACIVFNSLATTSPVYQSAPLASF